jgi:phage terminase large subunit-like protein
MSTYDRGDIPVDLDALEGSPCWVAVDVGLVKDLCAVVAAWPDEDEGYDVAAWFFVPKDNIQIRADKDKVPYPRWAEDGFISPTPGNVTDYRAVESHLRDLCERFDVREIAFDPAYAQAIMGPLTEDGLPTATMRQGWITMAPAIKELERAIIAGRFRHGGNPVLRWNFENVSVETDKAGNKSFHKGKSRDRIDGAQAAAMAVGRAHVGDAGVSVFDSAEFDPEQFLVRI